MNLQRENIQDIYLLSPLQEGLFFLSKQDPLSESYFQQVSYRLRGDLSVDHFRETLVLLSERHDILRTVFNFKKTDNPIQVVLKKHPIGFSVVDLSQAKTKAERDKALAEVRSADRKRGFDLERDVLMRMTLVKFADDDHMLVFSHHHIIMDGWCREQLFAEFSTIYYSLSKGKHPVLRTAGQYGNYIKWLGQKNISVSYDYWQRYLKNFDKPSSLGQTSVNQVMGGSYDYAEFDLKLTKQETSAIRAAALAGNATTNSFIIGLWGVVLCKYTNLRDVVFGCVVAGRPPELPGVESIIGLFVNTIPVRLKYSNDTLFKEIVKRTDSDIINALQHGYCSLAEIQNKSDMKGSLFDHILVFESAPVRNDGNGNKKLTNTGISVVSYSKFEQTSYDINIVISAVDEQLVVSFQYNRKVYSDSFVKALSSFTHSVVGEVTAQPYDVLVHDIGFDVTFPHEDNSRKKIDANSIYEMIERRAALHPLKTALKFGDTVLTYDELNRMANRIAHCLQMRYDVGCGDLVGLMVNRSERMIASLLGILKSGAAYIPIDVKTPGARVSYILNDTAMRILIIDGPSPSDIPNVNGIKVLTLTGLLSASTDLPDTNLPCVNTPDDLVYVIYTSGSTGKPKGVLTMHQNLISFVPNLAQRFSFSDNDVLLAMSTLTFDMSPLEIQCSLAIGITLVIASDDDNADPARIASLLKHDVTILQLTPSLLKQIIQVADLEVIDKLNVLIVGGEAMPASLHTMLQGLKGVKIYNAYGPTETTIWSSNSIIAEGVPLSLGKALAQESLHVLSAENKQLPAEVFGEIAIGGLGVSRGYLNNPELTHEKFFRIDNDANNRIYRTGDTGKIDTDGNIVFRGRNDFQVKIRGFRVELHEIEAAILENENVADCIVQWKREHERLVAFVVSKNEQQEEPEIETEQSTIILSTGRAIVKGERLKFVDEFRSVCKWLDHWALSKPTAVAASFNGERITYRDLAETTLAIAKTLQSANIHNGLVPIYCERSIDLLVMILGVWRAGMAYVPLDTSYPDERLSQILYECNPAILLTSEDTQRSHCLQLENIVDQFGVHIHTPASLKLNVYAVDLPPNGPADLAYVIFTSGSTGKPKGAMIEHAGMMNHIYGKIADLDLVETSVIAQTASQCFDISVWQFFTTIVTGGTVVIYPNEIVHNPSKLLEAVVADGITEIEHVPSYLSVMLESMPVIPLLPLRHVVVTGEAIRPDLVRRWFDVFPSIKLVNAYGPTEASDDITHWVMTAATDSLLVPLGRPLPNVDIYLLHGDEVCATGIKGEICVSGICVGRGYINDPEQTSRKFTPDILTGTGRMYRTGDIGVLHDNSILDFHGRNDSQVKVAGHRIELDEVESCVLRFPGAAEAVVKVITVRGNKTLHAWTRVTAGSVVTESEVRSFLASKLPHYMVPVTITFVNRFPLMLNGKIDRKSLVPGIFVMNDEELVRSINGTMLSRLPFFMIPSRIIPLNAMPLNKNGKIDRKRLSELDDNYRSNNSAKVFEDKIEEEILNITREIIGNAEINIEDNLFDKGGHSLTAMRLIARIYKAFGISLDIRDVFATLSLLELAELVRKGVAGNFRSIPKLPKKDRYAVSSSQRRLWVIDQFESGVSVYNITTSYQLPAYTDIKILRRSVAYLVDRHESLRTVFPVFENVVYQQVLDASEPDFEFSIVQDSALCEQLVSQFISKPLNLEKGPLFAVRVFQVEGNLIMILCIHHIISDGWSMEIIMRELMQVYDAFTKGESEPLRPLQIQYKDYVGWMLSDQMQSKIADGKKFWTGYLHGTLPVLNLPYDRARGTVKTYNGSGHVFILDENLTDAVRLCAKSSKTSPFMVLSACLFLLLHKYSGQSDIIIGTPMAGREHPDLANQVGFFANTLALRASIDRSASFSNLLNQVSSNILSAFQYQDYPFDLLLDDLNFNRDASRSPLFDVMIAYNVSKPGQQHPAGIVPYKVDVKLSKFDLSFNFTDSGRIIGVGIEYNTDLFDLATIARLSKHFGNLVLQVTANQFIPVSRISTIDKEEKESLLKNFTSPEAPINERGFIGAFMDNVTNYPDSPAVSMGDVTITYGCLSARANAIADQLVRGGLEHGDFVVTSMTRSIDLVCSMVGIFMAGGVYTPIDPVQPVSRVKHILNSFDFRFVLTTEDLQKSVGDLMMSEGVSIILADKLDDVRGVEKHHTMKFGRKDPAYLIFTSGSSGLPKGAIVSHGGLVNHLQGMVTSLNLDRHSVVPQTAPQSFDISVWQFLTPLYLGTRVVIYPEEVLHLPPVFIEKILRDKPATLQLVPSYLTVFLDNLSHKKEVLPITSMIVTGEAVSAQLATQWFELFPSIPLINAYGPTEVADDVALHFMYEAPRSALVPIGQVFRNLSIYVLDEDKNLCPPGIVGEICIAGVGVGSGYVNQPEYTSKVFIPDPVKNDGSIVYMTGDVGFYLPGNTLQYLGRRDQQVKIRGNRVELGEIENAILKIDGIADAVVVHHGKEKSDAKLIAFIVLESGIVFEPLKLSDNVAELLPSYMVPTFVLLEAIPLNVNGKADRMALAIYPVTEEEPSMQVAAETVTEQTVLNIWHAVLKKNDFGVSKNFFDLGGDSIDAIQIASKLHGLSYNVYAKDIFQYQTVKKLAARLERNGRVNRLPITSDVVESSNAYDFDYKNLPADKLDSLFS